MKYIFFVIIPIIVALMSCKKESDIIEDHFFVENNGATMPVLVKGNLEPEVIVLFLHGGPGGNASQASFLPAFKELETNYAIAYWDQRASGLSQGNPDKTTFTVEQFVEDLDIVVQALQARYSNAKIFLFGHSWGGALGSAYLSTGSYQDKITGFICMNSGHNLEVGLPLSVDWVENYANQQISQNNNTSYWNEVYSWCTTNPDMTIADNYFKYVEYLKETDAYHHDNQDVNTGTVSGGDVLNSHMSLAIFVGGGYLSQNFNILELNLSSEMNDINIPALVIWGEHDGVNTLDMGYDAFNSIGTNPAQKEMIILNNSAHEGYLEEPEIFKSSLINFVEAYK
ncbi:MAG: alpha/beta hydrolase [Crocinitomicaceae bacterium]|nr:alpha/beta hydrolase [Crocinitomicaceae bacterium]